MAIIDNPSAMETIRLKIKSNGTPEGTMITDELGRIVENVKDIEWFISGSQPARAKVTMTFMEADIEGEFLVKKEFVKKQKVGEIDYSLPDFDELTP